MPPHLALLQQHFQVVEHQQHPPAAQFLQQQAQAALQALGHDARRLGRQHLQAVIKQGRAVGGIAQRAKDHHREVLRQLLHGAHHQRRLAYAAHAQHAHQPAALLHHPVRERRQFRLAIIEGGDIQHLPPLQLWPWRRLSRR